MENKMDVIKLVNQYGDWNGQTAEFNDVGIQELIVHIRAETKEECAQKVEQFRTKMDAGIDNIAEAIRSL